MKRIVVCLVMIGLARVAAAQAPELVTAALLEKRVPEELAAEGLMLSRRNLGLHVEQLGDRWLVSLADLTTGRIAASTKLDALPADREAAVAAMTHVVAELASQIVNHGEPPPPVTAPAQPAVDDRAERAARDVAELTFKRKSIRVGGMYQIYQGDLDQELAPVDFYNEVGRPDLARSYRTRRNLAYSGMIIGGLSFGVGFALLIAAVQDPCVIGSDISANATCEQAHLHSGDSEGAAGLVLVGAGLGIELAARWLYFHPHLISANEAKDLADGYNQRLRGKLGLPVVSQRPPRIEQLAVVPYAANGATGITLTGRF